MPISRVRSLTLTSIMFIITMPPTTSAIIAIAPATAPNQCVTVEKKPTSVLLMSSSNESGCPGASCRFDRISTRTSSPAACSAGPADPALI